MTGSITDVAGILVGQHHRIDEDAALGSGWATGTTVVLAPPETVGAVDVRGGAPGTRETDLLDPANSVRHIDAVLLTGGSAYGLAAADGVMAWLEDHDRGLVMEVPYRDRLSYLNHIVSGSPAAVLRALVPTSGEYTRLMKAKLTLERDLARGGWGPEAPGGALKPGESAFVAANESPVQVSGHGRVARVFNKLQ